MKNGVIITSAVLLSIASFGGMMRLKTDVEDLVNHRSTLVNEQISLKEDKRVLEAELAYLSRPQVLDAFMRQRGYVELPMTALQTLLCAPGDMACTPPSPPEPEVPHVAVP